jgi:hypothetical protein
MKLPTRLLLLLAVQILASSFGLAIAQEQGKQASPANAQKDDPFVQQNAERRAQNPSGLTFTLHLKGDQNRFHSGELIQLELSFSSTLPKTYILDEATYDRSGRLSIDEFVLDHNDDTADPLADYFNSSFGFIGGGMRGMSELSEKPEVVLAELNEWIRFDKPGHYRLYVSSERVSKKRSPDDMFGKDVQAAFSNIIEFDILPRDEKWASKKLGEIVTALKAPNNQDRDACRALRFLGSRAAVGEMIKRLRGEENGCDFEFNFGLIGSPHRDLVTRSMEEALSSADQPVTTGFLVTLGLLSFTASSTPLPLYPEGGTEPQQDEWETRERERGEAYDEILLAQVRQLITALPQKRGVARAISLKTLIEYHYLLKPTDSAALKSLLSGMPDVFFNLPPGEQVQLLEFRWQTLDGPAMLPTLHKLYGNADDRTLSFEQIRLRSLALRRINQLLPEEGRRLILDEIRRPKPRVFVDELLSLPDESLPEVDNILAANLENSRKQAISSDVDSIGVLIERYATSAIYPTVKKFYEAPGVGRLACRIQSALLAYLLRVDPASGGELLGKALSARDKNMTGCYALALTDVAKLQMTPEVESAALTVLEEKDQEMVSHAAEVLGLYGSAAVEEVLWRRFERWHEELQSREAELREQFPGVPRYGPSQLAGEALIEQALVSALGTADGWLADPQQLKRLRGLCLTDGGRHEVDNLIGSWNFNISVSVNSFDDSKYSGSVAQYKLNSVESLKRKLLQFPRGTRFRWSSDQGDPKVEVYFKEVKSYLEDHGLKLERP